MELSKLKVYCLFLAAASGEMAKRSWLIDSMTVTSGADVNVKFGGKLEIGTTVEIPGDESVASTTPGQVITINDQFTGIVTSNSAMILTVAVLSTIDRPIYHRLDEFDFTNSLAAEHFGSDSAIAKTDHTNIGRTTVGRFIENIVVLQLPTSFKTFGYLNTLWSAKKILKLATDATIKNQITIAQYRDIVDHFFFLNHIAEICVPSMSVKSLMTDPKVAEVKAKFIEEHKGQMNDPFVIKELEDKLIAMDKDYLAGDPSTTFFDGLGSKSYALHRKKLFIMVGGVPAFNESTGEFDFNPNSLVDGWKVETLPSIANEIRKGSYERGRETAKGGAETKLVYRVFQDLVIDMDDCGTKRTIAADFKRMFRISDFIGRTINVDGVDIVLTPDNIKEYDGKVVRMYSPLTCENKGNLCYKCCGQKAKQLGVKLIGLQTIKITSGFMLSSMKFMHGSVLQARSIKLSDVLL